VRGTAFHGAAQVVTLVAGYVVAVVLGRELGPERYGVYGVVISVLVAVELIGRLGIPQATAKLVAEVHEHERSFERTAITLTAATFLAIGAAFAAAAPLLARAFAIEDGAHLFRLAAIDIPFYGMCFCLQHILNGQRRFGSEGLGVSLYGTSKALGVLSLLAVGVTVERALIVNVLASVVGCGYFVTRLSPGRFRPALSEAGPILRVAGPIALFVLASQLLQNFDLWFLKWIGSGVGGTTIGHYVAATTLARLPGVAHFVMVAVLVPTVSRAASVGDTETLARLVRGAVRFLVLVLPPSCAFLAVRSEQLMELVFTGAYSKGALIQAILVVRYGVLGVLLMTFCSVLIGLGEPRRAALQMLQLVPLGAVLAPLLIRSRALPAEEGAAWAALLTILVGVVLSGLAVSRRIGPPVTLRTVASAALVTALLAGVLSLWSPPPLLIIVELVVAVPALATLLVILGAVSRSELAALLRPGVPPLTDDV